MAEKSPRGSSPSSEEDLGLKLAMRRIFWGMNYATRINLLLALPGSGRRADELSDLDCVGFSVGGDFSLRLLIADCKSGSRVSPAARLFWVAGVREFFGGDRAYAVMLRKIPAGVRGQAGRLGVDVLGQDDLKILENVHAVHAPVSPYFEVDGSLRLQGLTKGIDKRLDSLVRFRDHEYWYLPPERRMQRLLGAMREAGPALDVNQRSHVVLVMDLLFLLSLSLIDACRFVSSTSLADPRRALLSHLLGGVEQTRSRERGLAELVSVLRALPDQGVDVPEAVLDAISVEPPYFELLAETVTRMLRRPRDAQRLLRYFEWRGQVQVGLDGEAPEIALGPAYGEYTRKLAGDIGRMCVSATGLDKEWLRWLVVGPDSQADRAEVKDEGDAVVSTDPAQLHLPS